MSDYLRTRKYLHIFSINFHIQGAGRTQARGGEGADAPSEESQVVEGGR